MVALSVIIAGTIGTYSDLQDKVSLWLDRDDLTARVSDFTALLEARLNRELRSVMQDTREDWTVTTESYTLPPAFRKLRRIHIEGSPDRPLVEMGAQAIAAAFSGDSGIPQAYYIEGRTIFFAPPPSSSTTINATYSTRVEPLSDTVASNWVLDEHPDVYLFGTLLEAAIYIRDEEAISFLSERLETAMASLIRMGRLDRYGGGPLVPKGIAQVRGARC